MLFNQYFYALNRQKQSPTSKLLALQLKKMGWKNIVFPQLADFSENDLRFAEPAARALEHKHLFAQLCQKYCPESIPATFLINDENWADKLAILNDIYYKNIASNDPSLVWILKPALLNNGEAIHLFQHINDIEQHYINPRRLGGPHVLQRYINNPHLLQGPKKGHKYSLRLFMALSSVAGAFLYPHGYFNIALEPYCADDYEDLSAHLTNEHLSHEKPNVVQIPTWQYALFKPFYPQIKKILTSLIKGLKNDYPSAFSDKKKAKLALFGMDFIVDAHEKVWLIEANHAPCFPTNAQHPLYETLYEPFWYAFVETFILNKAKTSNPSHCFERL